MGDWADQPLFDTAQLTSYLDLLSLDQVGTLMEAFVCELETRPAEIGQMVDRGDVAGARAAAHRLKGAALTIGGCRVAALAQAIDAAGVDALPALTAELPACASATLVEVRAATSFLRVKV